MNTIFGQFSLNEVATLKSSSILIYSYSEQSIYTQCVKHDAILIKAVIKIKSELKGVNEMFLIRIRSWKLITNFEANAKQSLILLLL